MDLDISTMVLGRIFSPVIFKIADKRSTGKDFARFFDCAKRALQSVHEKNEIGLNKEALERKICLWVQSLREEVVAEMRRNKPAEGVPDPPLTEPPMAADGDHANEEASDEKKTVFAVEGKARKLLGRKDNLLTLDL